MRIPARCPTCIATGTTELRLLDGAFGQPETVDDSDSRRAYGPYRLVVPLSARKSRDEPIEFCLYGNMSDLLPSVGKWGRYLVLRCFFCGHAITRQVGRLK